MATKLGGTETVQRASRVNIQGVRGFGDGGAGELARSINNVVQSAGKVAIKEMRVADAEDRMDMKNYAIDTNIDITNGMSGASKDPVLNSNIESWRGAEYSETEIRTMAHDYKRNEALLGFDEEGTDADGERASTYFETLNSLELRDITPLAQKDLANKRNELKNKMSSSFMVGVEPLSDRFKDAEEVARTNGIPPQELNSIAITSAFGKAFRTGDTSDIEALKTLTNSNGIRIIDTVEGSKIYSQMLDAKDAKDSNDEIKKGKEFAESQKRESQTLYSSLLKPETLELTKAKMDSDVANGLITQKQHSTLNKMYDALQESTVYPTVSKPETFSELNAKARLGVLPQEEILSKVDELSKEDFRSLVNLANEKGGATGIGNELNDLMDNNIKQIANAYSGLTLIEGTFDKLRGSKLGFKRKTSIQDLLRKAKYDFVNRTGALPDDDEFDKMLNKVLLRVDATVGTIEKAKGSNKTKAIPADDVTKSAFNSFEEKVKRYDNAKSDEEAVAILATFSPEELKQLNTIK